MLTTDTNVFNHTPPSARILKEYRKIAMRKYRNRSGKMLLEGEQLVREALLAGAALESLLYTPEFILRPEAAAFLNAAQKDKIFQIDAHTFEAIAQTETPQGISAIAAIPPRRQDILSLGRGFFLIIDRIQDPGNLGTIIRTAAAADVTGLIILRGTTDPYSPKAVRASMGGIFYLPVILESETPDWYEIIKENGIQLVAAAPHGMVPYYTIDFKKPTAVIIGNESGGVAEGLMEKAEIRASIPLKGRLTALNAAIAAAAFIFENQRQNL